RSDTGDLHLKRHATWGMQVYGMNFANMPELETRFGYYVVLIVIAAAFTCASRSPDGCRRGTARLRPALSQACCGPSPR
ncbi:MULTISPECIES: CorA family divalent cation transporter, partial [Haematobacter]|uniref:CorA family divalent cation transporter n=1 Tax=Haematobacter TaxID=366614 RepID=UPI0023F58880